MAGSVSASAARRELRCSGYGTTASASHRKCSPRGFDLFFQADHSPTKSHGGLGVGLALVKNLVELHDGTVEARSAGIGEGAEFVIRLPLGSLTSQVGTGDTDPETLAAGPSSGRRLLVVDDNQDAAVSLATLLRLQGHNVRTAHNGASALELN